MWEPRYLTTLQASKDCYKDSFMFLQCRILLAINIPKRFISFPLLHMHTHLTVNTVLNKCFNYQIP